MHEAARSCRRILGLLSPESLKSRHVLQEWAAAMVQDPTGAEGRFVPVRVRACQPEERLAESDGSS